MKRSGTTIVFVLIWVIVLVGAYGLGVCIREYRFNQVGSEPNPVASLPKSATAQTAPARLAPERVPAPVAGATEERPSFGERPGFGGDRMVGNRPRLEDMSEEERQAAMSRMRDRFGGRRREGMPQLSDEDREKMRAEIEDLRARWEEMSEEERQEAQDQMREKYGFAPRGFGGGGFDGGGFGSRSFGGEGGRRRPGGRSNNEGQ